MYYFIVSIFNHTKSFTFIIYAFIQILEYVSFRGILCLNISIFSVFMFVYLQFLLKKFLKFLIYLFLILELCILIYDGYILFLFSVYFTKPASLYIFLENMHCKSSNQTVICNECLQFKQDNNSLKCLLINQLFVSR